MSRNAQAHITADLRSGVDAATLFERLYPGRRHTRFESHSNRRPEQAEPEVRRPDIRQPFQMRQGQQGHPNDPSLPPSKHGDGGPNAHDEMPSWRREARFSSISGAGPRASFYNSSISRSLMTADRSLERTEKIIQKEINDVIRAVENRSETINVGKMMKIPLPEYIGGESIDAFLKFLQELLVYLINYNLMKPEADAHRVSLLGSTLKDRVLRWYQHTIHLNADGDWTFELAMIELKDTSSRTSHLEMQRHDSTGSRKNREWSPNSRRT
jgi:hypothetical protein